MPRHKVVSIALDACDPNLARAFAERGLMPNLARLLREASHCTINNPFGLFVNALWINYATALRPSRHGFHCWDKVELATYKRQLNPPRLTHLPSFWKLLSDQGCRVALIDVPHRLAGESLNGLEISEWGCHDRHHGFRSSPPELADEIEASYGLHPIFGIEPRVVRDFAADDWIHRAGLYRTVEEEKALLSGLLGGTAAKLRFTLDLFRDQDWDFFGAVFGESHAIGHQQWHLHDPHHPRHDPRVLAELGGDPIAQIYAALDTAIGAVANEVDEGALLLVHLSHGMGPHFDATHLLEEILARFDRCERGAPNLVLRNWTKRAASPFITPLRWVARAIAVPGGLRQRVSHTLEVAERATPQDRARQRYFVEPNNTVYGGIRLNLVGREPNGCVQPDEVDAVCARLEADLLEIRDRDTGGPIIRAVIPCSRHHERRPDDIMPDLLVEWTHASQVTTVTSPKIGVVHAPYRGWRTGDHRPEGLLVARGPSLPPGRHMPAIAVEDIGPSIAARLGVALDGVDGKPVDWLAGNA